MADLSVTITCPSCRHAAGHFDGSTPAHAAAACAGVTVIAAVDADAAFSPGHELGHDDALPAAQPATPALWACEVIAACFWRAETWLVATDVRAIRAPSTRIKRMLFMCMLLVK